MVRTCRILQIKCLVQLQKDSIILSVLGFGQFSFLPLYEILVWQTLAIQTKPGFTTISWEGFQVQDLISGQRLSLIKLGPLYALLYAMLKWNAFKQAPNTPWNLH